MGTTPSALAPLTPRVVGTTVWALAPLAPRVMGTRVMGTTVKVSSPYVYLRATPAEPWPFFPRVPKSLYQTLGGFASSLRVEDKKLRISNRALLVLRPNRDFISSFSRQPTR